MSLYSPDEVTLKTLESLLDNERPLSAWQLAEAYSPLKSWQGCLARNLAVRIAAGVGDSRLAHTLAGLNWRKHPEDDDALYACIVYGYRWRPLDNLDRIEARFRRVGTNDDPKRADFLALRSVALALLRDYPMAHRAIDEALALSPPSHWLLATRSVILEKEDRYDEALSCAREALQLGPGKPRTVLQLVDCLIHCGLDDEAIALLEGSHEAGETGRFAERLVNLYSEREDHQKALHYLKAVEERYPLCDKAGAMWIKRRYADLLYMGGDYEGCLTYCDQLPDSFHSLVAEKMRFPGALQQARKRLEVPFIRQHNMTCAPATLAALAAYWGKNFDHLEIAEAICYEGTPWHKGRTWAEQNGFHAVEFKLTHEILVALIDRDIPFTLSTEDVGNSHMQACIGYDNRQGTVLVRDPTVRHFVEIRLDGLIETHPIQGPRCMVMIPCDQVHRLVGLTFPDAEDYTACWQLSHAFDSHDRTAIRATVDAMREGHPLTIWSKLRIAGYDRNPAAELFFIQELLKRFPDHPPLRYALLWILKRGSYLGMLKEFLAKELKQSGCDPLYYSEMGELLQRDARNLPMADYYLRKAVRLRWATAQCYTSLSACRRSERRFEESASYLKIASCLEPGNEWYAASYAQLCRVIGRPEEGVAYLQERIRRLGSKSGEPWQTLASELHAQGKTEAAIEILDQAVAARPGDGELMLGTGRTLALWGSRGRGDQLMMAARGKVHEAEWHRQMAEVHAFYGRRQEAIRHRREHLRLVPHAIDSYRSIAHLIAQEEGTEEVLEVLAAATKEFPHFSELWCLRAEWEATLGPDAAIVSLRKAVALDPDSLWTLRELAIQHSLAGDTDNGLKEIAEVICKDPNVAVSHRIHGAILERAGRINEAQRAYREAIRLDVDETSASERLVRLANDVRSRLEALRFIESEMRRQVSNGAIVPVYRDLAYQHLEPADLLTQLRGFCDERPDLFETWSGRLTQALNMNLLEEAFECAGMLTERFPLLPQAWAEASKVHHAAGDFAAELKMLEEAVALSPAWDWAARQLSIVLERVGRYEEAVEVLERAINHEPLVGENYGFLSNLLWKMGRKGNAFECLKTGMKSCPFYEWGWITLGEWGRELKREEEAISIMESHRDSRGHSASWWCHVAGFYGGLGRPEAALCTVDAGLARHPKDGELFQVRARLLEEMGRFREALEACTAGLSHEPHNRFLAARRADILMASGEPNEAIRQMTDLVDKHPDFVGGIEILAGWLEARERWDELRSLCLKWVRQEPLAAIPLGFLGSAEESLLNESAAIEAFEKAFFLSPSYYYAGRKLLWFQIKRKEFEAADRTLKILEHYASSELIAGDAVKLALAKGDRKEELRLAEVLLSRDDLSTPVLNWIFSEFSEKKRSKDWTRLLDHRVRKTGNPTPVILEGWINTLVARKNVRLGARILRKMPRENQEIRARGWVALLESSVKEYPKDVRRWIRKNRDWFRSRNDLWGAALGALVNMGDLKSAAKWGSDWESRGKNIPGWLLFNYAIALGETGGWRAAVHVREIGLERYPAEPFSASARTLVALQSLLAGDVEKARVEGGRIEVNSVREFYLGHYHLYQSLMAVEEQRLEKARDHYQTALQKSAGCNDREVDQFFQDAAQRLAERVPWANRRPSLIYRNWGRHRRASQQITWGQMFFFFWVLIIVIRILVDSMSR